MEETQYLWRGAPAASRAQGEQSTYNHIKATDDEQKTVQELRGLFPTLKTAQSTKFFNFPTTKTREESGEMKY